MIYYLLAIIIPFIGFWDAGKHKGWSIFTITYLVLFLCFGYMTGSDWRNYESYYYDTVDINKGIAVFEPGFVLLVNIFKYLGIGFWEFSIFFKVLLWGIMIKCLKKYCPKDIFSLALMFFVGWYCFYLFIDCPFRNIFAITIFVYSVKYIINPNLLKYLLFTILAISFHISAVFMIPLYFLANIKWKLKTYLIMYIVINIVFVDSNIIFSLLEILFSWSPLVMFKLLSYRELNEVDSLFTLGMILHNVFFILLIISRKVIIEKVTNGLIIFNFSYLYLLIYRAGLTIEVFYRFQLFLCLFLSIGMSLCIYKFVIQNRLLYSFFLLFVTITVSVKVITTDFRYIPYTNYLYYQLRGVEHDYIYRDSYNYEHSPYNKIM